MEGGEALPRIATVDRQVLGHQCLEQGASRTRDGALLGQDLGHGPVLGLGPGVKGNQQGVLIDHPILKSQQTEEQVEGRVRV